MDILLTIKGMLIGLSIAAPVGPIGVLCIQRTLAQGKASGFATGLGAASADAVYGLIAGLGLTVISDVLIGYQLWIQLLGVIFLLYLGVKTILSRPSQKAAHASGQNIAVSYFSSFLLTLANPMTILSFAAILGASGIIVSDGAAASALTLVFGIFSGSALWWGILSFSAEWFREQMGENSLTVINRISGGVMILFGIFFLAGAIYALS
ncbi:LysE family transporter [Metabacillus sp. KIGAM252]|uniref:LysE family transporter n=1 Tax=Metabacillus flavus TaxID=2823519 RepID=A0ABS5LB38_9BACI|nr:LysE family transporter [Metabacillus flavus]MBS2967669.1 LysE family transporter [Metabacillus flavus]